MSEAEKQLTQFIVAISAAKPCKLCVNSSVCAASIKDRIICKSDDKRDFMFNEAIFVKRQEAK